MSFRRAGSAASPAAGSAAAAVTAATPCRKRRRGRSGGDMATAWPAGAAGAIGRSERRSHHPFSACHRTVTHRWTKRWISHGKALNNPVKQPQQRVFSTVYRQENCGRKRPCTTPPDPLFFVLSPDLKH